MILKATDSLVRPARRTLNPTRLAVLSLLSIAIAFGCGNDGSSGTNGAGAGAAGGDGVEPFSGAVLCSFVIGEPVTGFIRLVPDEELEAAQQGGQPIDSVEGAIEVPGGVSCGVGDRSVFALNWESPTITRFDEVDGALVQGETVSLANFGLSSLASVSSQTVIVSDTKAYYVDAGSLQIIAWNPSTMETIGSIPLTVADSPEGLQRQPALTVVRIDEQLLVYNSYLTELDISAPRADLWFFDSTTDQIVATDVIEECGDLRSAVRATNGDLYIGSGSFSAAQHALGLPGSYPPCAIRIRAGTLEIDTSYRADLNAVTGGLPTGGPYAAIGDQALLLAYDTESMPIDPMSTASEIDRLPNWNFYEWVPGTEQPATRVESIPTGAGRPSTTEFDGRTFLVRFTEDFASTTPLDLTRRPVEVTFTFTNTLNGFARIGTEPEARMAQQIGNRSLSVLPFLSENSPNQPTGSRAYRCQSGVSTRVRPPSTSGSSLPSNRA